MPVRNQVGPDIRNTFILKIFKYTTALQKLGRIRVETYFRILTTGPIS